MKPDSLAKMAAYYKTTAPTVNNWKRRFRERAGMDAPLHDPCELLDKWPLAFNRRAPMIVTQAATAYMPVHRWEVAIKRELANPPPKPTPEETRQIIAQAAVVAATAMGEWSWEDNGHDAVMGRAGFIMRAWGGEPTYAVIGTAWKAAGGE